MSPSSFCCCRRTKKRSTHPARPSVARPPTSPRRPSVPTGSSPPGRPRSLPSSNGVSQRNPSFDRRPIAEDGSNLQRTPERLDAVAHVRQTQPVRPLGVEADAVVAHGEREFAFRLAKGDQDFARLGVFGDVLKGLEHAEVNGGFRVLPVAPDTVRPGRGGHGDLPRLRLDRRGETIVGEKRRIDASGEVAQVLEGLVRLALQIIEHRAQPAVLLSDERGGEALLHRERHELLLYTVVDVALDPPSLRVLRRDEPLTRCPEVLDEADVAENETGLNRQVLDEP